MMYTKRIHACCSPLIKSIHPYSPRIKTSIHPAPRQRYGHHRRNRTIIQSIHTQLSYRTHQQCTFRPSMPMNLTPPHKCRHRVIEEEKNQPGTARVTADKQTDRHRNPNNIMTQIYAGSSSIHSDAYIAQSNRHPRISYPSASHNSSQATHQTHATTPTSSL